MTRLNKAAPTAVESGRSGAEVAAAAARVLSPATRIAFPDLVVSGGQGAVLWDQDGRRFLDFHAMAAIMNVGYGHPRQVAAIVAQAGRLLHGNPAYVLHEAPVRLAERLCALTPGDFPKRVAFGLSGSDTVDGAIKLARAATGRAAIVTYAGAYHGNTYGALSVSSASPAMRAGFDPVLPDVITVEFPSRTTGRTAAEAMAELTAVVERAGADRVAAVIIEPVQGDSGVHLPPAGYLAELSAFTRRHGIVLIADEVQTGLGRTGAWFALDHDAVAPDIVLVGKALGGGMPISALVARSALMDSWRAPGHVFSTSANPVASASALAVLDIIEDEQLIGRSRTTGALLAGGLQALRDRFSVIQEVRGAGLMLGAELAPTGWDPAGSGPEARRLLAAKVVKGAFDRGCFLTFLAGSVLRFAPPLVIEPDEVNRGLEILADAIDDVMAGRVPDDDVSHLTGW